MIRNPIYTWSIWPLTKFNSHSPIRRNNIQFVPQARKNCKNSDRSLHASFSLFIQSEINFSIRNLVYTFIEWKITKSLHLNVAMVMSNTSRWVFIKASSILVKSQCLHSLEYKPVVKSRQRFSFSYNCRIRKVKKEPIGKERL